MIKEWSDEAWEEFLEQVKKDRNFLKRIEKILKDIERNGYIGIGKPEPLKYGFSGYWSRRIDSYNRIVYKIKTILLFRGYFILVSSHNVGKSIFPLFFPI